MNRSFDDNLKMGTVARNWVIDRLMSERWSVVALDELPASNGYGPRSSGRGGFLTLPDLQIAKHGTTLAVEVKGKTVASKGILSGEPEHGCEERLYDDYRDYDRQIMPTFIVVVVLGPAWNGRDTYAARVTELRPRLSTFNGRAMAYWPQSQMTSDWLLRLDRSVVARNNAVARQVVQQPPEQLGFAL